MYNQLVIHLCMQALCFLFMSIKASPLYSVLLMAAPATANPTPSPASLFRIAAIVVPRGVVCHAQSKSHEYY